MIAKVIEWFRGDSAEPVGAESNGSVPETKEDKALVEELRRLRVCKERLKTSIENKVLSQQELDGILGKRTA